MTTSTNNGSSRQFPYAREMLTQLNVEGYASLVQMFEQACVKFGDSPAFACLGQELTFTELEKLSRCFAAYLLNVCGLERGDRIAIQLPNLSQYPVVAWGALRAGLVVVNTNPMYTERELLHQFNDSGARALVVLNDLMPTVEKVVPQTAIEWVIATNVFDMIEAQPLVECNVKPVISLPEALQAGEGFELPTTGTSMDDLALLQYTGGTTGVAKGSMLTQGNLFASMRQSATAFPREADESVVIIAPMPLYHIYGFTMNLIGIYMQGGMSVLIPDPRNIDSLIDAMKTYPFTGLAGVNTLLVAMLNHPEFDQIDFSHLKGVIAGGAALVTDIADQWLQRTGTEIFEGYGLSETTSAFSVNSPDDRQLGTVGKPMVAMDIKVIDPDGATLPVGGEGELVVRGPQIMQGYWQRPEATAQALDDEGWFRTGDVAIIQEDGYVRIVDRLKDMILVSGFNVYPNEIEDVVCSHPDILECAAVGVADAKSGEAVKLYAVSTNPQLDAQTLQQFCREQLTGYKVPKYIEFMADLPKSNVGKILRRELRD